MQQDARGNERRLGRGGRAAPLLGRAGTVSGWVLGSVAVLAIFFASFGASSPLPDVADVPGIPSTASTDAQDDGLALPVSPTGVDEPGAAGTRVKRAPSPDSTGSWRVVIPAIQVDAPVLRMSVDEAGRMMVPSDGLNVGWYDFTAAPGTPGNAVMSGHVDFGRSTAVFWSLRTVDAGDLIIVSDGDRAIRYAVESVTSVPTAEAEISAIIGERSGAETLTLITCGGSFDASTLAYDRRVVVRAIRI